MNKIAKSPQASADLRKQPEQNQNRLTQNRHILMKTLMSFIMAAFVALPFGASAAHIVSAVAANSYTNVGFGPISLNPSLTGTFSTFSGLNYSLVLQNGSLTPVNNIAATNYPLPTLGNSGTGIGNTNYSVSDAVNVYYGFGIFNNTPGIAANFPSYLQGLDYVITENNNKNIQFPASTNFNITVTTDGPGIAYLFVDTRVGITNNLGGGASGLGTRNNFQYPPNPNYAAVVPTNTLATLDPVGYTNGNYGNPPVPLTLYPAQWVINDGWQLVNTGQRPNDYFGSNDVVGVTGQTGSIPNIQPTSLAQYYYAVYAKPVTGTSFTTKTMLSLGANNTSLNSSAWRIYGVAFGPANPAPSVSVGPDQTLGLAPNTVLTAHLYGKVGSVLTASNATARWSVVSSNGTVVFGNANSAVTTVTITNTGTYQLKLTGTIGATSVSMTNTLTVNAINLGTVIPLTGPSDLDFPGTNVYAISVGGNGGVTLGGVTFSGDYQNGSGANSIGQNTDGGNGANTSCSPGTWADPTAPGYYPGLNQLNYAQSQNDYFKTPTANGGFGYVAPSGSGQNGQILFPICADTNLATIMGTARGDSGSARVTQLDVHTGRTYLLEILAYAGGQNANSAVSFNLSVGAGTGVTGQGNLQTWQSANPAALLNESTPVVYKYKFTATADALWIGTPGGGNQASNPLISGIILQDITTGPTVTAGPDQSLFLSQGGSVNASLSGSVTSARPYTSVWSVVSGPGTVTFGNATNLATTATFTNAGTYTLKLTATDNLNQTTFDTLKVTVTFLNFGTLGALTGPGSLDLTGYFPYAIDLNGPGGEIVGGSVPFSADYVNTSASGNQTQNDGAPGTWASPLTPGWYPGLNNSEVAGTPLSTGDSALDTIMKNGRSDSNPNRISQLDIISGHTYKLQVLAYGGDPSHDRRFSLSIGMATADSTAVWDTNNLAVPELNETAGTVYTYSFTATTNKLWINAYPAVTWTNGASWDPNPVVNGIMLQDSSAATPPPMVNAGAPQSASLSSGTVTISLAGTAIGGYGPVTTTWSVDPGAPGSVVFGTPSSLTSSATFTNSGNYTLRLTANDGVNPPVSSTVNIFIDYGTLNPLSGPGDLDLTGTFAYAIDLGGPGGETVGSVLFSADNTNSSALGNVHQNTDQLPGQPGTWMSQLTSGWYPGLNNIGGAPSLLSGDPGLDAVMSTDRNDSSTPRISQLNIVSGHTYKLQVLMFSGDTRNFNLSVGNAASISGNTALNAWQSSNLVAKVYLTQSSGQGQIFTYPFKATGNSLWIGAYPGEFQTVGSLNPVINAIMLTDLGGPPTVSITNNGDGTYTVSASVGSTLYSSANVAGPYTSLSVQSIIVNPKTAGPNQQFYRAGQ